MRQPAAATATRREAGARAVPRARSALLQPQPAQARSAPPGCVCGGGCPRCGGSRAALPLVGRRQGLATLAAPPPLRPEVLAHLRPRPADSGHPLPHDQKQRLAPLLASPGSLDGVRLHTRPQAQVQAVVLKAQAFAIGNHISFGPGRAPQGRDTPLLLHELAHVVQQRGGNARALGQGQGAEQQADAAAHALARGRPAPGLSAAGASAQRRVEMRDVGRGEFSGMARLPELVARLNEISPSLLFDVVDGVLTYEAVPGLEPNDFDRQMMAFIDSDRVLPMRLTDRHGLTRDAGGGFNDRVFADNWSAGYVDIDDLLESSPLGLQSVLVHFLQERLSTPNYARRIGSPGMNLVLGDPAVQAEFNRVHRQGVNAEVQLLRDFFGDPSLRFVTDQAGGDVARVYTNDRRDRIRTRVRTGRGAERGVDAVFIDVVLRGSTTPITPEEYRDLLAREREAAATAAQIERERLGGATEHRAGGRSVPAP